MVLFSFNVSVIGSGSFSSCLFSRFQNIKHVSYAWSGDYHEIGYRIGNSRLGSADSSTVSGADQAKVDVWVRAETFFQKQTSNLIIGHRKGKGRIAMIL